MADGRGQVTLRSGGILMDSGEVRPVFTFFSVVQKQPEARACGHPEMEKGAFFPAKQKPLEAVVTVNCVGTSCCWRTCKAMSF